MGCKRGNFVNGVHVEPCLRNNIKGGGYNEERRRRSMGACGLLEVPRIEDHTFNLQILEGENMLRKRSAFAIWRTAIFARRQICVTLRCPVLMSPVSSSCRH
ncbi:hypothetical protein PIB30_049003 [Stylosanthes scabra]|uniref:Uncharacterized protein n=1 Tax=Stylosanthes scabra TaxID=79078 RepID=A0ABU6ZFZ4_9FABA|nr:hypothetical protein [Stylosanthes scabra]